MILPPSYKISYARNPAGFWNEMISIINDYRLISIEGYYDNEKIRKFLIRKGYHCRVVKDAGRGVMIRNENGGPE